MTDQLISYECAKLAKEKGFDILTDQSYKNEKEDYLMGSYCDKDDEYYGKMQLRAPTQSLLQKWLRETHSIFVLVTVKIMGTQEEPLMFWSTQLDLPEGKYYGSYEEALEAGLQEALKLIK